MTKIINAFDIHVFLTLQWIQSHCNIPGNERAITLAKKGADSEQENIQFCLNTAKQMAKSNKNKTREIEQRKIDVCLYAYTYQEESKQL